MYKSQYNLMLAKKFFILKVVSPILFCSFFFSASAQTESEIGLPFITNYTAKTFKALPQVWSIQEDAAGIMYFGVQNYILSYDGVKWRKIVFKVNSASTVVRSMTKNKEGVIYYGAYGDLGYLTKDSMGQTITKSLLDIIPAANRNFLDIWSSYATDNSIYFQSREYIFRIGEKKSGGTDKDREVKVWKPQTKFMYSFYVDGDFYVHQQGLGLFKMVNDSLVLVPGSEFLGKERMQVMLPYPAGPGGEKQYLVGMFYSGLYIYDGKTFRPFSTDADPILKSGAILYKGILLPNGNYALSSTGIGLLIIDAKGKLLQRINRSVGLQDESIYSTYLDKKGTLWLAMDNGISRVDISSPLTQFNLQSGITTGILSVVRFEGELYAGTTNGLLHFNKETKRFELVQGIPQNQVFNLLPDGNELLVSGDGLFAIKNKKAFTIRPSVSADLTLSIIYIPKTDSNLLLGGGQFGVTVFTRKNKTANWDFKGYIPGITDQIWTFAENKDGTFWAGSANGWDYRLNIAFDESGNLDKKKTSFIKYGVKDGYTNGVGTVVTIHDINYFVADSSLFTFDETKKRFVIDTTFGRFSKGAGATELTIGEDPKGIVWIKIGKEFRKAIPQPGGGYKIEPANLDAINEFTVGVFFPEKNNILWIGTTDGLIRYDENLQKNYDESFKAVLTYVAAGKKALSIDKTNNKKAFSISYKNNTLRFEYAAPFFEQEDKTQYQTWLEGFEKGWSDLGNNYYKEFTNLSPGKYTFHVRAVNIYNKQSDEATYPFEILPPWYSTWWAYLLYALVAAGAIYTLIRWRTRQLHEKHRELEKEVAQRTKELSHRVEELAVINSVQEGLVKEVGMQGIYELVGEKIREIFNAQIFDIVTYDSATNLLEDHYSYEKGDRTLAGKWEPSGFRKMVIDSKQPLIINKDLDKRSQEVNSKVLMGEQPKSALFVPLMSGGNVTGMISLQDLDKENAFPESSVNLLTTLANSMSVALESARRFDTTNRLLKETEERNAQLAVINSVQESLVAKLDMQGIYELVGEKIREIFDAQVIDIVTYDPATKQIEDRYAYEKGDRTLLGKREVSGFRKHVIQTKQLLLHNANVEKATREFNNPILIGEMPKSQIYVPLMSGDHVTGIISLQNLDHEHAFSDSDVNLLTTLVNSMSVALESARLFDETTRLLKETEQSNAELAVINSVQEGLASKLDMRSIYDLVGNKIRDAFDAQVAAIGSFDEETGMEHFNYLIEEGKRFYPAARPLDKLRQQLIETKQKIIVKTEADFIKWYSKKSAVEDSKPAKSAVYVPLIIGGKVKRYVTLQNVDRENAFSDSDVRLLETLANSMSVALENARLFDETTRLLKETEQRTAELGVINSVQEGLSKELDINAIYTMVGERIQHLFNAQVVGISTLNIEDGTEKFEYIVEKGKRFYPEPRPLGKLRLHMIKTKEKVIINRQEEGYAWFGKEVVPGTEPIKSAVFVPLMIGDKITSYVTLQNIDQENAFSPSDIRLLGTLANSMSVALENARLFDETNRLLKETEQRTAELAVINSVQEGLAKELDMQGIYNLIGNRIQKLFDAQAVIIATFDHANKMEHFNYVFENDQLFKIEPRPINKLRQTLIEKKSRIYIETEKQASEQYGLTAIGETKMPKSLLFVPLISGNEIKGYVSLQNVDRERAFSTSDIRLLQTLSNSMSVALENARLFDETSRLLKETEQRTAELAVINSVQDGLAKELDMQGIYDLIGNRVQKLFNAQVVIIASFDHEKKHESFNYAIEKGERIYSVSRPYDKVRQHLIDTGQNILINENFQKAAAEFGMKVISGTEMPKSLLFMPLKVGDKVTGYVSLQNIDQENAFSFSDVRLLGTLANSMSVALENARLFDETSRLLKETEQRNAELAVINSVQESLVAKLDMQGVYDLVGEKMREIFSAQVIDIVTYDKRSNLIEDRYSFEKGDRTLIGPREPAGFRKHVILTKQLLLHNENVEQATKEFDNKIIIGEMPKSQIYIPMMAAGEVTGIISLQNLDHEHAFSESDVNLITTLVNSMSVALESARLFDETKRLLKETEQRTAELGIINSVQQGLASKMDMQSIYDLVGEKMRELFNAQVIDIVSYDKLAGTIEDRYTYEKGDRTLLEARPLKGFRRYVITTGKPLVINKDVDGERPKYDNTVLHGEAAKSLVMVPMVAGNEVTGAVSLQNLDKENAFSESDVSLLITLSSSMSVALESAKRFDETKRLLKETEQRTAELGIINSVQEGLGSKLDIQAIYDLVGDKIRDVFDTQGIAISYYDRKNNYINNHYYLFKGKRMYDYGFELGKGLTSHVIQTAQPLLINENAIERYKELGAIFAPSETEDAAKSWLGVPLISGGKVNGTIRLENYEREHAYTESDVSLLQTLANSMSVALENARLFDETNRLLKETKQRTEELGVINSVQEDLVREINIQKIYDLVGDRICELFDTQTLIIRTFDHQMGMESFHYAIEKGVHLERIQQPFMWANKLMIENKQPILINENYAETAHKHGGKGVGKGLPPKSAIFVPMIVGDVVKGSVSLQNVEKENAFTESDLRLLTTLTNSMSVALENARLFDETTHLLSDAKQRASELSTVNSISKALASQLDSEELIQLVGDQLKKMFNANIVYLALLNKKTNIIYFPYQFGDDMQPLKLGDGLTSKVILSGEPVLLNKDILELKAQQGMKRIGKHSTSYLGVPIPVGDEIVGVMSVQSTEHENRFNENDQRLLSTIASSVGVALKNAQLFEEVQEAKLVAEEASKTAEKANQAKSAFLSTVSHELRTPLTSVLGFAKIINKRLDEKIFPLVDKTDTKTNKTVNQINENLKVVISEGERLTHLINDVLDLAKIEAGKMEWNLEDVNMAEVVERAIAATTSLFVQKDLKLIKKIDSDLPDISGDRDKLIQVIINLISNSVKFTEKGSITCTLSRKADELIVSIADTGIGIAKEDYGAVFEQFKQVGGDTLTDKPKGTGLGLPICKEIVEHHGGRIWLDSVVGKGSTFSFALPITPSTSIPMKPIHLNDLVKQLKEQMAFSKLKVDGKNATILVVDDDDSIRSLLHQELSDAGYLVEEAANGKDALDCIRKNRPDLIILDVMMPEINGFDVAAILKNDPQTMDIPIIVLSIVQDKARGFRIGVDRYLTKPIDTAQLFTEVGTLLEQGKSKKKVMVVDEDGAAVRSLTDVLQAKGYHVVESDGKELVEKAIATQPDIIILNSVLSANQEIVQTLRFEKGLENVLFFIYQ